LGLDDGRTCTEELKCLDCKPNGTCAIPASYNIYTVDNWGVIDITTAKNGDIVAAMQNEILQRGPIVCGVDANPLVRQKEDPQHI